jgi:hypothetical protein
LERGGFEGKFCLFVNAAEAKRVDELAEESNSFKEPTAAQYPDIKLGAEGPYSSDRAVDPNE